MKGGSELQLTTSDLLDRLAPPACAKLVFRLRERLLCVETTKNAISCVQKMQSRYLGGEEAPAGMGTPILDS